MDLILQASRGSAPRRVYLGLVAALLVVLVGGHFHTTTYAQEATPIVEPTPTPEQTEASTPKAEECTPADLLVEMTPVDFASLTWNGNAWGTTHGVSTLTITNPGDCESSQPFNVKLDINSSSSGLMPTLVEIRTTEGEAMPFTEVSLLELPAGFLGTTEYTLVFELTPAPEVDPGAHSMEFVTHLEPLP